MVARFGAFGCVSSGNDSLTEDPLFVVCVCVCVCVRLYICIYIYIFPKTTFYSSNTFKGFAYPPRPFRRADKQYPHNHVPKTAATRLGGAIRPVRAALLRESHTRNVLLAAPHIHLSRSSGQQQHRRRYCAHESVCPLFSTPFVSVWASTSELLTLTLLHACAQTSGQRGSVLR